MERISYHPILKYLWLAMISVLLASIMSVNGCETGKPEVPASSPIAKETPVPVPPPPTPLPTLTATPTPAPATFSISNLIIQPAEIQPGESVKATVDVTNTGGTEGTYTATLSINGVKEADQTVTVAPGSTKTVAFSVTRDEAIGYNVSVNGLSSSFTVVAPPAPTPTPMPTYVRKYPNVASSDDILVGAFYYPWYSPFRHWREGYKNLPIRGEYDSRDENVINAHIDEATGHAIDFFVMSWWGPGSWEDVTLKDYFLKAQLASDIKIVILYETVGRLRVEGGIVNLSDEGNKQILLDDFKYLADNYLGNPAYLTMDGKPVIFIYLTRIFAGDFEDTLTSVRKELRQSGYELFLIGDQVYWQSPYDAAQKKQIKLYDAITAYNMHTSAPNINVSFVSKVEEHYRKWKKVADELNVEFVPDVLPGFDDTSVRPMANHPVIQRTPEGFESFIRSVLPLMGDKTMLLITSYNEWHEGTEIESSHEHGAAYLEIIRETMAEY